MRVGRRDALIGALVAGACAKAPGIPPEERPPPPEPLPSGSSGSSGIIGLSPSPPSPPLPRCLSDARSPLASYEVRHREAAKHVFYTWTTPEQIEQVRRERKLFLRSERPGLGPGHAFEVFAAMVRCGEPDAGGEPCWRRWEPSEVAVARFILERFEKGRYAWPFPWATRMGWPGESYGDQLVRIELEPEAWLVVFQNWKLSAVDAANQPVPLEDVLTTPERIGAIYFVRDDGISIATFGCSGAGGFREYIVGNEAMIAEWSIQTPVIRAELEREIAALGTFQQRLGACDPRRVLTGGIHGAWHCNTLRSWAALASGGDVIDSYQQSLAIPSVLYEPTHENVGALIEALRAALFEPDPLVVVPA